MKFVQLLDFFGYMYLYRYNGVKSGADICNNIGKIG